MPFADLLGVADRSVRDLAGGDVITYAPGSGLPVAVIGVFDAVYQVQDLGDVGVVAPGPAAWLLLADLPSDPESDGGATVTFAGSEYRPWKVLKDGMGSVRLFLHLR